MDYGVFASLNYVAPVSARNSLYVVLGDHAGVSAETSAGWNVRPWA
jgi:hypothetical protein